MRVPKQNTPIERECQCREDLTLVISEIHDTFLPLEWSLLTRVVTGIHQFCTTPTPVLTLPYLHCISSLTHVNLTLLIVGSLIPPLLDNISRKTVLLIPIEFQPKLRPQWPVLKFSEGNTVFPLSVIPIRCYHVTVLFLDQRSRSLICGPRISSSLPRGRNQGKGWEGGVFRQTLRWKVDL